MDKLIVFSPHFDDAVLSAGALIEGHHQPYVVTGCTDTPSLVCGAEYDVHCGFKDSTEAINKRREENDKACYLLASATRELSLCDDQYGGSSQEDWDSKIYQILLGFHRDFQDQSITVVGPLATKHPDHVKMMNALLTNNSRFSCDLWLYEELPYRVIWPDEVYDVQQKLKGEGYNLEEGFIGDGDIDVKRAAVLSYRSQLWSLDLNCIFVPERFHRVA